MDWSFVILRPSCGETQNLFWLKILAYCIKKHPPSYNHNAAVIADEAMILLPPLATTCNKIKTRPQKVGEKNALAQN